MPVATALVAVVGVAFAASACTGQPLDLAPWVVPVPEGTAVHEYAAVPVAGRQGDRVELVEALVIAGDPDDPDTTLYRPRDVAVAGDGTVYVLDAGSGRIQVYDGAGAFVRSIGGPGQGPGELDAPRSITVAGDWVVVDDPSTGRLDFWSLDGEFLGAADLPQRAFAPESAGEGSMFAMQVIWPEDLSQGLREVDLAFLRLSAEGELMETLMTVPARGDYGAAIPYAPPSLAVSPAGHAYLASGIEYQIRSYTPAGDLRWALRTSWEARPASQETFERVVARMRERDPGYDPSRLGWPERESALAGLATDGSGNLWVFPFVHVPRDPRTAQVWDEPPGEVPVDVYSPDGEPLLSAMMTGYRTGWQAARGDHVYVLENDPGTEEPAVVRYRLVVPGR